MNPHAIAIMWLLAVLMAGAIALGPTYIFAVAGVSIAYTILGTLL